MARYLRWAANPFVSDSSVHSAFAAILVKLLVVAYMLVRYIVFRVNTASDLSVSLDFLIYCVYCIWFLLFQCAISFQRCVVLTALTRMNGYYYMDLDALLEISYFYQQGRVRQGMRRYSIKQNISRDLCSVASSRSMITCHCRYSSPSCRDKRTMFVVRHGGAA